MQRRREEERRRDEERKRNEERDRERRRREEQRKRSPSPRHRVQRKSSPTRQRRERSDERRHSSSNKPSTSRRRSTSSSRRQSALHRLGPKIPVVTRLGAGKVSRKRRRPGSNERYVCHLRQLPLRVIGKVKKKPQKDHFIHASVQNRRLILLGFDYQDILFNFFFKIQGENSKIIKIFQIIEVLKKEKINNPTRVLIAIFT